MKFYKCDHCDTEVNEPNVTVDGIRKQSGGILMPDRFHKLHFCSQNCFWQWVKNNL